MEKILLHAANGNKTSKTPVWLMRQAGRYLPEYRKYRQQYDTLTMFKTPSIAAEITMQPIRRFPLDGAIIYADILLIPDAMGLGLSFVEKEGPHFQKTVRSEDDLKPVFSAIENMDTLIQKLSYVSETIERVKQQLNPNVTLLGFAGAPFTVASYMIEGKSSRGEFLETRKLLYSDPKTFHALMDCVTQATISYLKMQIKSGVEVIQLFESWSAAITSAQYREFCLPYTKKIVAEISKEIPVICFFGQGADLTSQVLEINPHVYSVDWRQDLESVSKQFSNHKIALQGNLDPALLYAPKNVIQEKLDVCLAAGQKHPHGYIFNLGHGITQHTPVENVEYLVNAIRNTNL